MKNDIRLITSDGGSATRMVVTQLIRTTANAIGPLNSGNNSDPEPPNV